MKIKKPHIRLMDISHERGNKTVFTHIDAAIVSKQIVGLIGPNGAGKSTLLNIISGELEPRGGKTEIRGDIGIVTQGLSIDTSHPGSMTVLEYIQGDNEVEEREIMVALGRTSGDDIDIHQDVTTLSGGQQTKVRMAKCLVDEVDILLLDEPTNHLDQAGIKALTHIVKRFHGPVVIVSHDRQFLDDVTTHIFDLRFGVLEQYTTNYTGYIAERALRNEKQLQQWKDQEEKKKRMEKWLAELRQRANIYDSPRWGKLIRSRQKMYDKTYIDGAIAKPQQEKAMGMGVSGGTHKYKKIVTLESGVVYRRAGDGKASFAEDVDSSQPELCSWLYMLCEDVTVLGQDRVVLVGENGSGKSTLIHVMREYLPTLEHLSGAHPLVHRGNNLRVGWFMQQDDSLTVDQVVMHWCMKHFPDDWTESIVRSKLAGAGIPEDDLVKEMSELSYGQRVKIRFLQLMVSAYDLLIMDEPTNHLDIETRESLETMLLQYEGALIVISHDRRFVEEIGVMKSWTIADGELIEDLWTSTKAPREPYISSREKEAQALAEKEEEELDPYDFMWK